MGVVGKVFNYFNIHIYHIGDYLGAAAATTCAPEEFCIV